MSILYERYWTEKRPEAHVRRYLFSCCFKKNIIHSNNLLDVFFSDAQIRPFLGKISLTWNCSALENNCEVFYAISISIPIIPIVRFNVYKIIHLYIYIYMRSMYIYIFILYMCVYLWMINLIRGCTWLIIHDISDPGSKSLARTSRV